MSDFFDDASKFVGDTVDMIGDGLSAVPAAIPEMVAGGYDYLTGDTAGYNDHLAEIDRLAEPANEDLARATDDVTNMAKDVGIF